MELRQLRYFAVLAEELSFTRAAARLNISQPPLSMQIAQLEAELGATLLRRTSRRVELTEAGESFLQDVRAVLTRLKDASARVRTIDQGLAGQVRVGLSGSHFLGPLPELIARYSRSHPEVVVVLGEMTPADQLEALKEHRIDVSLTRADTDDNVLEGVLLWPDPVVAVVPADHELALHASVSLAQFSRERFVVLRRDTSAFANHVFECCARAGFDPQVAQAVSEVPAQLRLVEAGLGVALVPASTTRMLARRLVALAVEDEALKADVYAVVRRDSTTRARDTFLASIRKPLA